MIAIGLDVGGTKIAGGLVDLTSGEILKKKVIATLPIRGGQAVFLDCLNLAGELKVQAEVMGLGLGGVGIGVAELVDPSGEVTSSQTIDWAHIPVEAGFSALAPAVVEADVRAAALAESAFGAGRAFKIFVYVTVGTGISSSLVVDGVPFAGAHGNALVMASGPLTSTCPKCGNHFQSVLEDLASGPALVTRYGICRPGQAESAEEVMSAAVAGDPMAIQVVESAGEALGSSLAFLINVLDPEAVVVGGGLGVAGGPYWKSMVDSTRRHIWAEAERRLPVLQAGLGADAGLIGAALASAQCQRS